MAVAALVLGILGTLFSLTGWFFWIGVPLSVIALILGIVGRKQAANEGRPTGMATAGLVLGIIGAALGLLVFVACASCMKKMNDVGKQIQAQADKANREHAAPAGPPAALGQPVTFAGDSSWVVTAAEDRGKKLAGAGGAATTAGRFVQVSFTVTNLGKKQDSLLDLPAVVDAQGRELKPYEQSARFIPAGAHDLAMAPLPPSLPRSFVEIYEVPADATGLAFKARALAPFGDTKLVALGLPTK